jgi:uroporphyrinogen decarboxylase
MTMTRIENLRNLIRNKRAEWIPFTLDIGAIAGFTAPVLERFRLETGGDRPEEFFDYDFRTASLKARFGGANPSSLHTCVKPGTTFDEWGIGHWAGGAAGTCDKAYPPLAGADRVVDIEKFPEPVIETGSTASAVRAYHAQGYPVFGYGGSVYEWSWWLRGMENFLVDLQAEPALAEAVIQKVARYTRTLALETARAGADVLCFYDDAGMQTGLQVSPQTWRQFIKPRWREILAGVRASYPGRFMFLHSCGKIEAIIPDIIEAGFDILHPVQPECMDYTKLRREYGRDIVLCACISSQRTLPFGTPGDVREWVAGMRELCRDDHNAVFCPSNLIQPETPWENIIAFAESAKRRD